MTPHVSRDGELSTTGLDASGRTISPWDVVRHVLNHINTAFEGRALSVWNRSHGGRSHGYGGYGSSYSSDCLRHWGPNGGCIYSDMSKVECCTAETTSPLSFAAQSLGILDVVEAARRKAEEESDDGDRFRLSTANVDPLDPGIAWGTHLNVSVSPELWEDLFQTHEHPDRLGFVASAIAAGIAFFGGGYLLPMKDGNVIYSLSGRAHHLSRVVTLMTTEAWNRGILNSRDEAHSESAARLHLIGFDWGLASSALLAAYLQGVVMVAENHYCRLNLYSPVHGLRTWSWGLDLDQGTILAEAALTDGRRLTLPAYIRELVTVMVRMRESGLIDRSATPESDDLLGRILELTEYVEEGSIIACAPHLDWAAKLLSLLRMCDEDGATLGDADTRLLDHDFTNTDPRRGLFWQLWGEELVDPLVTRDEVEATLLDGPAESRAWGRGRIIQRFASEIADIDWSHIELTGGSGYWSPRLRVEMPDLDSLNREQAESLLDATPDLATLERRLREQPHTIQVTHTDPVLDIRSRLDLPTTTYSSRKEE